MSTLFAKKIHLRTAERKIIRLHCWQRHYYVDARYLFYAHKFKMYVFITLWIVTSIHIHYSSLFSFFWIFFSCFAIFYTVFGCSEVIKDNYNLNKRNIISFNWIMKQINKPTNLLIKYRVIWWLSSWFLIFVCGYVYHIIWNGMSGSRECFFIHAAFYTCT